jgi:hypothetical protein
MIDKLHDFIADYIVKASSGHLEFEDISIDQLKHLRSIVDQVISRREIYDIIYDLMESSLDNLDLNTDDIEIFSSKIYNAIIEHLSLTERKD